MLKLLIGFRRSYTGKWCSVYIIGGISEMMWGTIFHNESRFDLTSGITTSVTQDKFKRWAFSFQVPLLVHLFLI